MARHSDPGNPRESILPPIIICPKEGELFEWKIPIAIGGEKNYSLVDATDKEDAIRIYEEYLAANGINKDTYKLGNPTKTGGKVTWTGPRMPVEAPK